MVYDTLIHNGLLVTMNSKLEVIKNASILVNDGRIEAIGKAEQFDDATAETIIDGENKIIMPGLINCHTHLPMSMFRGIADDLPLDVWLNEHIFPAEASLLNPESVLKWACHSCKEMLLSGTTTCCDGYFYEDEVVKAVAESGIRAVLGQGVIDFPGPGVPDPAKNITTAVGYVNRHLNESPLISPSIFCHSPYICSKDTLIAAKTAAKELGVLFQIHVAETQNEINMVKELKGRSIIQYLNDIGILDEKTLLVHTIWVDDKDIEIIKISGASVAHCPESNMKLASGIAPIPKMLDQNICVGLGTDGCASNNDHDLFSEMDVAAKLHKVALLDPCVMDAKTTLKTATIQGAKAIGLGEVTGSIEEGKHADIILVDHTKPHTTPMFDPYSCIVYSAKASDVTHVLVNGKMLVQEGTLV